MLLIKSDSNFVVRNALVRTTMNQNHVSGSMILAGATEEGVAMNLVRQVLTIVPVCVEQVFTSCLDLLQILLLVLSLGIARKEIAPCAIGLSLDSSAALRSGFCG